MDRRLIEDTFPLKIVNEQAANEKSVRHGNISTLHVWWARRPLVASRTTIYSSLLSSPNNENEYNKQLKIITDLSKWKNSNNRVLMEEAKKEILKSIGHTPKILDPFGGGGSIPLEALRLGCETHTGDYNPVATILLKCVVEYPQRYGNSKQLTNEIVSETSQNELLVDVRKWAQWILVESSKEIEKFYPKEKDGSDPIGFIWARTLPCQNPNCGIEIPLMRQFWLGKNSKRRISLYPYVKNKQIEFKLMGTGYDKFIDGFNPEYGTVSKAIVRCLSCDSTIDGKTTKKLFKENKNKEKLIIVIYGIRNKGKKYRIATEDDMHIFQESEKYLDYKRNLMSKNLYYDPIPDEKIIAPPVRYGTINVGLYGMYRWGDLFNSRQKLSLLIFCDKIRSVYDNLIKENVDKEYAKVITTYLAILLDRLVDKNSTLVVYNSVGEKVEHTFGRQALGMLWDYVEVNPFTDVGWPNMLEWVSRIIEHCSLISNKNSHVQQLSAMSLPYSDGDFDAVFTDPPYYDNIPYSYLSDFFYVWLKRTIGFLYPDLFSTPLTPKSEEIVAFAEKQGAYDPAKIFFEDSLKKALQEIFRVLKINGIAVIVYAHKSTEGWETLINSILGSGLVITNSWPINTEMKTRLRSQTYAALNSSIYMIARKWKKEKIGFYRDIKNELKTHLKKKLDQLWKEGISGANFFISAIGSSIEVFGKYEKVVDDSDNPVEVSKLLEDVRRIVTDYALRQVIHNGFSDQISHLTRFYILWRWAYGEAEVPFDDANKLSQSVGLDLPSEWNKGFIVKNKEFVRVLGPSDRNDESVKHSTELIDIMHYTLLLWKKGNRDEMNEFLKEMGYHNNELFKKIAQAISESLPLESTEKKWIDGLLTRYTTDNSSNSSQTKLF